MAGSLVYRVMYGYQVLESEDPFIKSAEEFMVESSSVITAGWVVDFFPIRKHTIISNFMACKRRIFQLSFSEAFTWHEMAQNCRRCTRKI